ncbi:MAG: hypothetical protein LJE66_12150, partial [Desulfobacterales bacterium]|nr:hypothetical protein [Desulfobacterales bacterium]
MKVKIGTSPSYLVRNPYTYCFRMNVPKDLQSYIGRKELRYSLKTGYLGDAKYKARVIAGQVQLVFKLLRKGNSSLMKLSDNQIQEILQKYLKEYIDSIEERMYSDDPPPFTIDTRLFHQYVNDLDDIKQEIIEYLGTLDYRTVESIVDDLLKENGIDNIDRSSVSYQKLCRGILKAQLKGIDIEKRQMRGEYSDDQVKLTTEMLTSINSGKVSKMLSEVSDEYWKESESGWKDRTIVEYRGFNKRLLESLGYETEVHTIDFQTVKDCRDNLKETGNKGKPLSIKRVNMYIEYATALFNFAKRNKYISENPASGLMFKDKRSPDQITDVFDKEDLQKLFLSKEYIENKHLHSHNFWVPILGLFTGCRLEEICQLYVDDVKEVNRVWVLDINEKRSDQSVKTSERRLVPLHPLILDDLKFLNY